MLICGQIRILELCLQLMFTRMFSEVCYQKKNNADLWTNKNIKDTVSIVNVHKKVLLGML